MKFQNNTHYSFLKMNKSFLVAGLRGPLVFLGVKILTFIAVEFPTILRTGCCDNHTNFLRLPPIQIYQLITFLLYEFLQIINIQIHRLLMNCMTEIRQSLVFGVPFINLGLDGQYSRRCSSPVKVLRSAHKRGFRMIANQYFSRHTFNPFPPSVSIWHR